MCLVLGFLETPLVTQENYWVELQCGTYLKTWPDERGLYFRGFGGNEIPCPVHQPTQFSMQGLESRIEKFGPRTEVDIILEKPTKLFKLPGTDVNVAVPIE